MSKRRDKKNEQCFAGIPNCGYSFESARKCFIACPANEFGMELTIIKNVLESFNYEPYIAVEQFEPAKFAFCRKICSEIIQSHFCIVLLNPPVSGNKARRPEPNPNVHYEYGMMCAMMKTVIPLAKEGTKLAFNVAPLDTKYYNDSNLEAVISPVIEAAVRRAALDDTGVSIEPNLSVFRYLSLKGLWLADLQNSYNKVVYDIGVVANLYLFTGSHYGYFGNYSSHTDREICLNIKILSKSYVGIRDRLSAIGGTVSKSASDPVKQMDTQLGLIHIYLMVADSADRQAIMSYVESITDFTKSGLKLVMVTRTEIEEEMDLALTQIEL